MNTSVPSRYTTNPLDFLRVRIVPDLPEDRLGDPTVLRLLSDGVLQQQSSSRRVVELAPKEMPFSRQSLLRPT